MIDGSHHSFEDNIALTKKVVDYAHAHGVTVEGELGVLAGVEDDVVAEKSHYTKPEEVIEFVTKTGCDSLAISIGTSHGANKFTPDQCTRNADGVLVPPPLRFDILEEIELKLPGFPIVLHGSSSVPPEDVDTINNLLAKEGLKPSDVSIVGVGAGAGAVAAIDKGELDGIANLDPVITQLEATGKYVVVADSRTEKGMKEFYGGDYLASCLYANEDFIKKNPATTQAAVNAMVRALRWIAKATPEQIMAVVPEAYLAGNRSIYKQALLKNMIGYSTDGQMRLKAANNVYVVLKQFEPSVVAASAAGTIKLESTFDNSFAVKAGAKYK